MYIHETVQRIIDSYHAGRVVSFAVFGHMLVVVTGNGTYVLVSFSFDEWRNLDHTHAEESVRMAREIFVGEFVSLPQEDRGDIDFCIHKHDRYWYCVRTVSV